MYRIPDNLSDEARAEYLQDAVKKFDEARDHRTSHVPPMMLECQAAGWQRGLFVGQYALYPPFARGLSILYEAHRNTIAALSRDMRWWHIRHWSRYDPLIQAYFRDVSALAEAYRLDRFRQTSGPLAYFGYEAIRKWCFAMCYGPVLSPSEFAIYGGLDVPHPHVGGGIRIEAIEDPARIDLEPRDVIEARLRSRFEHDLKDALDQRDAAYLQAGYKRGDTATEVPKYAQWTFCRFVRGKHFKDIAKVVYAADETVRLRTNEFAKKIGFSPERTRRRDSA